MWNLFIDKFDFFADLTIEHLAICSVAIVIAVVLGGLMGILISEYNASSRLTIGVVNFLYTIPSISMLGLLIPFTGVGNLTAIIALTIYALLPMVRSTNTGITNVDPIIIEAAEGMGSTRLQLLYKIKLPLAIPVILSGIRNMVTMTIALGGVASFIGAGGLGVAIYRGITTNNSAMTIIGSLLIAFIALLFDYLLGLLEKRRNRRWGVILLVAVVIGVTSSYFTSLWSHNREDTIHIATKPVTEEHILGEMLAALITQYSDLEVTITHGVGGGTSNIHPGMVAGDFDIYPEYTGTAWNIVLRRNELYNEDFFEEMATYYRDELDMEWVSMYGFASNYGIALQEEIAEKYNIQKASELSPYAPKLIFGAEYDFYDRLDGYDALTALYNLNFKSTVDLDMGLKYKALEEDQVDVMPLATTDAQLTTVGVRMLEDDRFFFPTYECGNIVRGEILRKYPDLRRILGMLDNCITDEQMSDMNYQVEIDGEEPRSVAIEFLKSKGIL